MIDYENLARSPGKVFFIISNFYLQWAFKSNFNVTGHPVDLKINYGLRTNMAVVWTE